MEQFAIQNKLSGVASFDLGASPWLAGVERAGILPVTTVLQQDIGPETILALVDKTPFIYKLSAVKPFRIELKQGLVNTSYGPLMFLLFWVVAPKGSGAPFVMLDCHVDPLCEDHMSPWRRLGRQSHAHVVLIDAAGKVVDLLEFSNSFNLREGIAAVERACAGMSSGGFDHAKAEFMTRFTLETLFQM